MTDHFVALQPAITSLAPLDWRRFGLGLLESDPSGLYLITPLGGVRSLATSGNEYGSHD